MTDIWNAKTYSLFLDTRTRFARNLLAEVPYDFSPKVVWDLGCGPGNSTVLLKNRFQETTVIGFDNSQDMINEATRLYPEISFQLADIAHLSVQEKADCIFANATLQWLDHHEILIPKLVQMLNPGGIIAIQMPNNFHAATHQTVLQILQTNPAWQELSPKLPFGILQQPQYNPAVYYDILSTAGLKKVDCWEAEYFQEMNDHKDIIKWMTGTALRPILSALDSTSQELFLDLYLEAIRPRYPAHANGKVLMPYRRVFMVGVA